VVVEVELATKRITGAENIALKERRMVGSTLSKEVAAQQRSRCKLHKEAGFLGVR